MEENLGKVDSIVFFLIGLVAIGLAFVYSVWWVILAAIALIVSLRKKCVLYQLLGINHAKKRVGVKSLKKVKKK